MNLNFSSRLFIALSIILALQACKDGRQTPSENGSAVGTRSSYSENRDKDLEKIRVSHSGNELTVEITIPPAHHAYLDSGKEGNLIPIGFSWKSLNRDGSIKGKPMLIKKPVGEFDTKVEATVLRGTGNFVFTHQGNSWPTGKFFKVLTQICNEKTGQCYPPSNNSVKIP